jgi:hypothetical protein
LGEGVYRIFRCCTGLLRRGANFIRLLFDDRQRIGSPMKIEGKALDFDPADFGKHPQEIARCLNDVSHSRECVREQLCPRIFRVEGRTIGFETTNSRQQQTRP